MVELLFKNRHPKASDRVLDPGCGLGAFIEGVLRWCASHKAPVPEIVGVESDPNLFQQSRRKFQTNPRVQIRFADFLGEHHGNFEYIVGNPPYVAITGFNELEKSSYRQNFRTATGRFDLYFLFFEQAINALRDGGRLAFITPEKFLYVDSARALRQLLTNTGVESIQMVDEATFPGLVTYPAITVLESSCPGPLTEVTDRTGSSVSVDLPKDGASWLPRIFGKVLESGFILEEACTRVSAGIATGADGVFVRELAGLDEGLLPFAHPTIAGRQIARGEVLDAGRFGMLIPYTDDGSLLPLDRLGKLLPFLERTDIRARLEQRTCVTRDKSPKPWYAFHETPVLREILKPKILCKDIAPQPIFVADRKGETVPRHSAYYIVPRHQETLEPILDYLASPTCVEWLRANCQRAANGYLRLQSNVLKRIPLPPEIEDQVLELDHQQVLAPTIRRAAG
jgi:hypothetical protein